jgi:hypothetical protein
MYYPVFSHRHTTCRYTAHWVMMHFSNRTQLPLRDTNGLGLYRHEPTETLYFCMKWHLLLLLQCSLLPGGIILQGVLLLQGYMSVFLRATTVRCQWGYWHSDSVFDQGGGVHHKLLMFLTWSDTNAPVVLRKMHNVWRLEVAMWEVMHCLPHSTFSRSNRFASLTFRISPPAALRKENHQQPYVDRAGAYPRFHWYEAAERTGRQSIAGSSLVSPCTQSEESGVNGFPKLQTEQSLPGFEAYAYMTFNTIHVISYE